MQSIDRIFRVYIAPGCVVQSVIIGGGYGTGREIVEYFTRYGFWGGLMGIAAAIGCMGLVLAITFEFSRLYKYYDYRTFIRGLLGPGWVVFELTAVAMLLLMLSVLTAAAGTIVTDAFHLPRILGLVGMAGVIGLLSFFGRALLTAVMTVWSFVLYAVFTIFLVIALDRGGGQIAVHAANWDASAGWTVSGLKYAFYNLSVAPLILYAVRPIETRTEAVGAGVAAAFITMVPAAIFHVAFFAAYPGVLEQAVPIYWMIGELKAPGFLVIYSVMLFGAFIRSGAGVLQGLLERVAVFCEEKGLRPPSRTANAAFTMSAILISVLLANLGVIALVAQGYGVMAWVYLGVFIAPLLTVGLYRIRKAGRAGSPPLAEAPGG